MWEKEPDSCRKTGKEVMEETENDNSNRDTEKTREDPNTGTVTENEQEDSAANGARISRQKKYILRKRNPWKTEILHQKIPVVRRR